MVIPIKSLDELYDEDPINALAHIKENYNPIEIAENIPIEIGLTLGFETKKAHISIPARALIAKPHGIITHQRIFLELESDQVELNLLSPDKEYIMGPADPEDKNPEDLEAIAKRIIPASILQFPGAYEKDSKGNITKITLSPVDALVAPYRGTLSQLCNFLKSKDHPIKIYSETQTYFSTKEGLKVYPVQ
jgi:hypothetical protein